MEIPEEICDVVFDQSPIKKGTVIKTDYQFRGKNHKKYFIVLNKDPQENPLVCVITTSQLDFYIKNSLVSADTLTIAPNYIPCFDKPTVVDCSQIYRLTKEQIKTSFLNKAVTFAGELPEDLIEKIDDIVRSSRLITGVDKKKILGDPVQP